MNDIEVSSIDLVEGGNVFKQGHYLTLGYVPRDEKGETVDLSGKTLNVSLWGRKGVVFEAAATYSAGVIRFTLDKMVPAGDYTVEFTVTSSTDAKYRKKFPTNQHSGRIAIKQSADDLGVVGIQVYTVAQLKAEQKALLDAAVSGFTVDSETKMARVSGTTTHPTIGARLEADKQATAAQLAETNNLLYYVNADDKRFNGDYQSAINATPDGAILYFPSISTTRIIPELFVTKPITIEFHSPVSSQLNKNILKVNGTRESTDYILSANVSRGDRTISLSTTPTGFTSGDFIVLQDDTVRPSDSSPNLNMEVHEIESVTGNTLTLTDYVRLKKTVSVKSNVFKFNPVKDVYIKNPNFQLASGSVSGRLILVEYGVNIHVSNLITKRSVSPVVAFSSSYNCSVNGFDIREPVSTGSGKGYGIQVVYGSNNIKISNGYAKGMRHAIDLNGSFSVLVEDVKSYSGTNGDFMITHNGFDADITFQNCHSFGVKAGGYGFACSSQGVVNVFDAMLYNINLINCSVQINEAANSHAISLTIPLKDSTIENFIAVCGDGKKISSVANSSILIPTNNTDITIRGLKSYGFWHGIQSTQNDVPSTIDSSCSIKISDVVIKNSNYAITSRNGEGRKIRISGLTVENIAIRIFQLHYGSIDQLDIKDVDIRNSSNAILFAGLPPKGLNGIKGVIENIKSDVVTLSGLQVVASDKLTFDKLIYYNQNGNIQIYSNSNLTLGTTPLDEGIVEGQKLTIHNVGNFEITLPAYSKIVYKAVGNLVLNTLKPMLTIQWMNGKWYEV